MPAKPTLAVPGKSNVDVKQVRAGKCHMKFPRKDGFIEVARDSFEDQDDLLNYLVATFPVVKDGDGRRFTVKRTGKYQRVNKNGDPVLTLGDPVLDLITDEHGWITISGQRHNLAAVELADPGGAVGRSGVDRPDSAAGRTRRRRQAGVLRWRWVRDRRGRPGSRDRRVNEPVGILVLQREREDALPSIQEELLGRLEDGCRH
jgi:hypothetical protein